MPRAPKKKTLCLVMIVKNETKVLPRCFASIADHLDYWVIHDTGSTDGTPQYIQEYFKGRGIPGELHNTPWRDFGYNRTQAVQSAYKKADLLLLMDADFIFHIKEPQDLNRQFKTAVPDADGYLIGYEGPLDYRQTLMVNGHLRWRYVGVTHEYIHCEEARTMTPFDAFTFIHPGDGGCRSDKFERDIRLLHQGLEKEPNNSRYMFYLAQSYKDIQKFTEAIPWYQKRIDIGGWGEEVYYAMYQKGMSRLRRGDALGDFMGDLTAAYLYRPTRLEALFYLVNHCRINQQPLLGYHLGKMAVNATYPKDVLFVEKPIYDYLLLDEIAQCAYSAGKYKQACQLMTRVVTEKRFPAQEAARLEAALTQCKARYLEYLQTVKKSGGKRPNPTTTSSAKNVATTSSPSPTPTPTPNKGGASKDRALPDALANRPAPHGFLERQIKLGDPHGPEFVLTQHDPKQVTERLRNVPGIDAMRPEEIQQLVAGLPKQQIRLSLAELQDGSPVGALLQRNRENLARPPQAGSPRVLILGNFITFLMNKGISNNRLKFFRYLSEHVPNLQIHGPGLSYVETPPLATLLDYVYKGHPEHRPDVIVTYLMGTTDFFMGPVVQGLEATPTPQLLWIEDIFFADKFIPWLKTSSYRGVLLSYLNENYYQQFSTALPDRYVARMEPFIEMGVFRAYDLPKQYDILLYGYHGPEYYRFRSRLYQLLAKSGPLLGWNIRYIPHPGYNNRDAVSGGATVTNADLSREINQAYLTICTSNDYNIFVKKYIEVGCSNSIIAGPIPEEYRGMKSQVTMLELREEMSDQEILQTLAIALADREALRRAAKANVAYFQERFSYERGLAQWQKIIKEFHTWDGKSPSATAAPIEHRLRPPTSDPQEQPTKPQIQIIEETMEKECAPVKEPPHAPATTTPSVNSDLAAYFSAPEGSTFRPKMLLTAWDSTGTPAEHEVLRGNLEECAFEQTILLLSPSAVSIVEKLFADAIQRERLVLHPATSPITMRQVWQAAADLVIEDAIAVIARSTVTFDETLAALDQIRWHRTPSPALVLLCYRRTEDGDAVLYNNNFHQFLTDDTQDVWAVKTPFPRALLDHPGLSLPFAQPGTEGALATALTTQSYQLLNCPFEIRAYIHPHLQTPDNDKMAPLPQMSTRIAPCRLNTVLATADHLQSGSEQGSLPSQSPSETIVGPLCGPTLSDMLPDSENCISGLGFQSHCQWSVCPRYPANFDGSRVKEGDRVFLNLDYFEQFLQMLQQTPPKARFALVTHNSDRSFTEKEYTAIRPWISHVYAMNCTCPPNPHVTSIPIGFRDWPMRTVPLLQATSLPPVDNPRPIILYMNFEITASKREQRQACFDTFKDATWVTQDSRLPLPRFYEQMTLSQYVLSPPGAGIDCHRVYEALYLGAIPILKTSPMDAFYAQFPVLIVKEWSEISHPFLEARYQALFQRLVQWRTATSQEWLTPEYWFRRNAGPG